MRVLEIGAGLGHNLFAFKEKYECALLALEPDPACEPALNRLGARQVSALWDSSELRKTSALGGGYDIVLAIHVLEHSRDPKGFITRIREVAASDGLIVVEVPNDPPWRVRINANAPHLSFFELNTLRQVIESCGAQCLFLDSCGPILSRPANFSFKRWLRNRLPFSLVRRIDQIRSGPKPALHCTHEESQAPERIPLAIYDEYGGPDRAWLRAVFRFA